MATICSRQTNQSPIGEPARSGRFFTEERNCVPA
jgi:hypothetical protein